MAIGVTEQMGPQWSGRKEEMHYIKAFCGSITECKLKLLRVLYGYRYTQEIKAVCARHSFTVT